jgi:stage 0 sporulation protein B (sporulation initiation phosphotransferase)
MQARPVLIRQTQPQRLGFSFLRSIGGKWGKWKTRERGDCVKPFAGRWYAWALVPAVLAVGVMAAAWWWQESRMLMVLTLLSSGLLLVGSVIHLWLFSRWNQAIVATERFCREETVELLRRYRHDVMNHLQLIQGYIQMDKVDRGREYIDCLAAYAQQHAALSHRELPLISYVALKHAVYSPQLELAWNGPWPAERLDHLLEWKLAGCLDEILQHCGMVSEDSPGKLAISFSIPGDHETANIEMYVSGEHVKEDWMRHLDTIWEKHGFSVIRVPEGNTWCIRARTVSGMGNPRFFEKS